MPTKTKTRVFRASTTTSGGNTLQFFYSPDNDLLVVYLVSADEMGGYKLVRRTLNEKDLLAHLPITH
jgi:hypothetical protein